MRKKVQVKRLDAIERMLGGEELILDAKGRLRCWYDQDLGFLYSTGPDNVSTMLFDSEVIEAYIELPWHEDIPNQGLLCWVRDNVNQHWMLRVVIDHHSHGGPYRFRCQDGHNNTGFIHAKPLTNEEIKGFLND